MSISRRSLLRKTSTVFALLLSVGSIASFAAAAGATESFDLVLKGGRVIDPETGLDATRDVGIRGDTIAAVSTAPLQGKRVIDASGLVVSPGFIELHQHGFDEASYRTLAQDGITTALEWKSAYPTSGASWKPIAGRR